jgi:ketopantoate hydroxymethyltransferase
LTPFGPSNYAHDVRARAFPGPEHVYGMKPTADKV